MSIEVNTAEINAWADNIRRAVRDFDRTDRKKILRRGAAPTVQAAKRRTPTGTRAHKRYAGGKVVATYKPGNLRKSIQVLALRKSPDVHVGPKVGGKQGASVFGPSGPADGYYASMVYGSALGFARQVLIPALASTTREVTDIVSQQTRKVITQKARQ